MVSMRELLQGHLISDVEIAHQHNLEELQKRINVIRTAWGKPMIVTSGYRTLYDHLRIYSEINARRRKMKLPTLRVPAFSRHLSGQAVDISDPDGTLYEWCIENLPLLEETGLWIEEKDSEKRVHFQSVAPKSGKRVFSP